MPFYRPGIQLRRAILVLSTILLVSFAHPGGLVKTRIDKSITVYLPKVFSEMTPEDLIQRFPSVRSPLGAYTDPYRLADFSVNLSATQWPNSDLDFVKGFFKSSILNLYDRVEFLQQTVRTINGKPFIVFEFNSRVNPDSKSLSTQDALLRYNYIMYHIGSKRTLVFSFGCTKDVQEEWQPIATQIMESVKVK